VDADNYEFYFNPAAPLRRSILMDSPVGPRYNFYRHSRPIITTNERQLTVRESYGSA